MLNALEELRKIRTTTAHTTDQGTSNYPTNPTKASNLLPLNTELERLHGYTVRLRIGDPAKGTRIDALTYLAQRIDKLAGLSMEIGGTADGWPDPADVFGDGDQIAGLRSALAELESGPYPAPLPDGCRLLPEANFDVFASGRLYNGAFSCSHSIESEPSCGAV